MRKSVLYSISSIVLILVFCLATNAITISAPTLSGKPGDTVTGSINIDDATGVAGGDITLTYDESLLTVKEAVATNLIKSLSPFINFKKIGKVLVRMANLNPLATGSGAIIELTFEIANNATGTIPLALVKAKFYDETGNSLSPIKTVNGAITIESSQPVPRWDVNADGVVDIFDLVLVGIHFGEDYSPTVEYPRWDVNSDGVVDISDLVLVGIHFGEDYRTIEAIASLSEAGVFSGKTANVRIDAQNKVGVQGMRLLRVDINTEFVENLYGCQFDLAFDPKVLKVVGTQPGDVLSQDGAPIYWNIPKIDNQTGRIIGAAYVRKAIKNGVNASGTLATVIFEVKNVNISGTTKLNLNNIKLADADARLIKAVIKSALLNWEELLVPEKDRLLQNYPNPFNPETWLPYQLATDAPVVIFIYNAGGQLVRAINIGQKVAGLYLTKNKAAYWDGRDDNGKRVASGVYFYQIKAGNFTATRKMVIIK